MQVLVGEAEYRKIQLVAKQKGMTLAEWVRQALRAACRDESEGDADRKLLAIRRAAALEVPTTDIESMLAEIESGYLGREPT
jgi:hypothetical protein